jgi:hypothetical protein
VPDPEMCNFQQVQKIKKSRGDVLVCAAQVITQTCHVFSHADGVTEDAMTEKGPFVDGNYKV